MMPTGMYVRRCKHKYFRLRSVTSHRPYAGGETLFIEWHNLNKLFLHCLKYIIYAPATLIRFASSLAATMSCDTPVYYSKVKCITRKINISHVKNLQSGPRWPCRPGLCSTHFFGLTRLWLIWQSRWLNSDSTQIPNLLTWLKSDSTHLSQS